MTHISAVLPEAMEDHPWQRRIRAMKLSQRMLARLLGFEEITVSRQLRGHFEGGRVPRHVRFAILAWERLTEAQRADLEAELGQDD